MHMTRSRRLAETRAFGGRKGLCVVMDEPAPVSPDGRYEFLFDKAGHCIVKFRLPEEATWEEARRIAHEGTARLPGRVLSVSSVFSRDYDSPVCFRREDGAQVCVSASYPDVFSAMEGGIACACVR